MRETAACVDGIITEAAGASLLPRALFGDETFTVRLFILGRLEGGDLSLASFLTLGRLSLGPRETLQELDNGMASAARWGRVGCWTDRLGCREVRLDVPNECGAGKKLQEGTAASHRRADRGRTAGEEGFGGMETG